MHPNPKRILPVLFLLLIAAGAYWYFGPRTAAQAAGLTASGTIEATEVIVASEMAGRITGVDFVEGDTVTAGQTLAALDRGLLAAQLAQAQKAHEAAQNAARAAAANLALREAGPTPEQRRVAESAVERAQASADAAQSAYDALPEAARTTTQGQTLKQQLDIALAALDNAQAQLDLLVAGARPEQIDAAQAQADAARSQADVAGAAVEVLEVQWSKLTLTAPADGTVLERAVEPGQVVLPGGTLAVLADLRDLQITVYVPEDRYGAISLGQMARVTVDSFPGTDFAARVVHIADRAEFTPRNVQTADGRKSTVYAIRLTIDNPQGRLHGALSADEGRVALAGYDLRRRTEDARAAVGYLPQRFSLYADLTALENLHFFGRVRGVTQAVLDSRSAELLNFVGLTGFEGRLAGQLSGGMKQKLGLACALVHRPRVLLLDEPTAGVDPVTRQDFWQLIIRLLGDGVAVLVSTPYMDEASRCQRLGFMYRGRLLLEGSPRQLTAGLIGRVLELAASPKDAARRVAMADPEVEDVLAFGDRLHLRVRAADGPLARLPAALAQAGVRLDRLRPIPPSLEDVFISLLERAEAAHA